MKNQAKIIFENTLKIFFILSFLWFSIFLTIYSNYIVKNYTLLNKDLAKYSKKYLDLNKKDSITKICNNEEIKIIYVHYPGKENEFHIMPCSKIKNYSDEINLINKISIPMKNFSSSYITITYYKDGEFKEMGSRVNVLPF